MASIRNIPDSLLAWLDERLERIAGRRWGDVPTAAFLLAPAVVLLGVFGIFPLFFSVYISLFQAGAFAGMENYVRAFTDPDLLNSFLVTLYYAGGTIPVTLVLSFLVASVLFRIGRARGANTGK